MVKKWTDQIEWLVVWPVSMKLGENGRKVSIRDKID